MRARAELDGRLGTWRAYRRERACVFENPPRSVGGGLTTEPGKLES
jgi:hypothetical protein